VPGFTGWGTGAFTGPTTLYKTTVSTFGTSGEYLLSPIPGALWDSVVQNTWFLADTPLTALSFGFLLSAKSVTTGHHLSTFTCLQLSINLMNISCLPFHSFLALVYLQHLHYYLLRDIWTGSMDKHVLT